MASKARIGEWCCYERNKGKCDYVIELHHINTNGCDLAQIRNVDKVLCRYEVKSGPVTVKDMEKGSFFRKDHDKNIMVDPVTGEKYYNAEI